MRSYLGLLCLGKSDFQAIISMRNDKYFQHALGIGRLPSAERMRQRLDEGAATRLVPLVAHSSRTMLKQLGVKISGYPGGLVPLDVDVFPQDNSNTRKKGVSRTYKNFDGYAPTAAYLGMEGWCLKVELRPGSQHGQAGFVVFIQRVLKAAHVLIEQEILVRLESAHNAVETREVIAATENHATSEQFHSEFKIDLDLERLPSGTFATNALVMALGAFAYNILRAIGQMGLLGQFAPIRHSAKRRRIRTVIQELMYLAGRLVSTGRWRILHFNRHCPVFAAFQWVYEQLVPARWAQRCG